MAIVKQQATFIEAMMAQYIQRVQWQLRECAVVHTHTHVLHSYRYIHVFSYHYTLQAPRAQLPNQWQDR